MIDLLALAWEVEREAISGGPVWIASERYDMLLKLPRDP